MHDQKMSYTVVVVAKNEKNYLPATLRAIKEQTIPAYRLVLVDDNSIDDTVQIAKQWGCDVVAVPAAAGMEHRYGEHINYVRNIGFKHISKDPVEYVVCIDADTVIPPTYCHNIIKVMKKYNAVVGSGRSHNHDEFNPVFVEEAGLIIKHDWFYRVVGLLLVEYRTLLVKALCHGNIIVHDFSSKYQLQRGASPRGITNYFDQGRNNRVVGIPNLMLILTFSGLIRRGQFSAAKKFLTGYLSKPSLRHSRQERKIMSSILWDAFYRKRLGRKNSRFQNVQDGISLISMPE